MDDEKRAALVQAIRTFTVDMPDDKPNGEAERQLERLAGLLNPGGWPVSALKRLWEANDAVSKMCAAMAEDLRALKIAAEDFFGGDFGAPAPTSSTAKGHAPTRLSITESQRQLVLLALAHLSAERPGFDDALNEIARQIDNAIDGRAGLYDEFRRLKLAAQHRDLN